LHSITLSLLAITAPSTIAFIGFSPRMMLAWTYISAAAASERPNGEKLSQINCISTATLLDKV
jgi:hypothetical protein